MTTGIVIVATNAYFVLGVRFIRRFMHYYKGNSAPKFYFFSDTNPSDYLPDHYNIKFIEQSHRSWIDATNSKFSNIISLQDEDCYHLFYFDADTNVYQEFDDEWFLGDDLVAGEHFGNRSYMLENKPFDRNPKSRAYIPQDTDLPQMYYYGAFFGGRRRNIVNVCKVLREWQLEDKKINHEPPWNDESYLNCFFHFNPPRKVVLQKDFKFSVSDKGGIEHTRNTLLNTNTIKDNIKQNKDKLWNIRGGVFELC